MSTVYDFLLIDSFNWLIIVNKLTFVACCFCQWSGVVIVVLIAILIVIVIMIVVVVVVVIMVILKVMIAIVVMWWWKWFVLWIMSAFPGVGIGWKRAYVMEPEHNMTLLVVLAWPPTTSVACGPVWTTCGSIIIWVDIIQQPSVIILVLVII